MEGTHRLTIIRPGTVQEAGLGQRVRRQDQSVTAWGQLNPRRSGRLETTDGVEFATAERVYRIRASPRLADLVAGWTVRDARGRAWEIVHVDPYQEPQARWLDLHVKTVRAAGTVR